MDRESARETLKYDISNGTDKVKLTDVDPFAEYTKVGAHTPEIIDTYEAEHVDCVTIERFRFKLREYVDNGVGKDAVVYALKAYPTNVEGKIPGIVFLHGGSGSADDSRTDAVAWAKRGYVVIAPDVPGVYNKPSDTEDLSYGNWSKCVPYYTNRWTDNITDSTIFDAVLTGVQSYHLLIADEHVDVDNVGVTGTSWGGYNSTILSGLLGDRIKATYARYNAGFYDLGGAFEEAGEYKNWIQYLDAGRRAHNIRSNYFLIAAAKDIFIYPPSINAGIEAVGSRNKNIVYAHKASHSVDGVEGGADMDFLWMDYYLKGIGTAFPEVNLVSVEKNLNDGSKILKVETKSELPITSVKLYYSTPDVGWPERKWNSVDAKYVSGNTYTVAFTSEMIENNIDYYFVATDGVASGGTVMYSAGMMQN